MLLQTKVKKITKISQGVFIPNCTLNAKVFELHCMGSFVKSVVKPFFLEKFNVEWYVNSTKWHWYE